MDLSGLWGPKPIKKEPVIHKTNKECFDIFIAELERIGASTDFHDYYEGKRYDYYDIITFYFDGARNSTILYTIEDGGIRGWFGKSNSDSGGAYESAHVEKENKGFRSLMQLHKRFMISGRRKVLRNYKG